GPWCVRAHSVPASAWRQARPTGNCRYENSVLLAPGWSAPDWLRHQHHRHAQAGALEHLLTVAPRPTGGRGLRPDQSRHEHGRRVYRVGQALAGSGWRVLQRRDGHLALLWNLFARVSFLDLSPLLLWTRPLCFAVSGLRLLPSQL